VENRGKERGSKIKGRGVNIFCWSKWYFCYFFFELVPLEQKPTQKRPLRRFSAFQVRFVDFFPQIWVIFEKKIANLSGFFT
jgi:hypothetical protein